jgi:parallel beta-helix repeat protein
VLLAIAGLAFNAQKVKAPNGVISIREDGSIDPPTAPIQSTENVTYTFTGNINYSVIIEKSNITIDGAGYKLVGPGSNPSFAGIHVEYVADNVTVENLNITGFRVGIGLISTEQNKIFDCIIMNNTYGIQGLEAMNNTISGNNIRDNDYGVYLNTGYYNEIHGNNITDNANGVWLGFSFNNKFYGNYFVDNTNHTHVEPGSANFWNETYPTGGNYWDDFEDRYPGVVDDYGGVYPQGELGSDGFWDGPYEIDQDNIDYYPVVPEFPAIILPLLIATSLTLVIHRRKRST